MTGLQDGPKKRRLQLWKQCPLLLRRHLQIQLAGSGVVPIIVEYQDSEIVYILLRQLFEENATLILKGVRED